MTFRPDIQIASNANEMNRFAAEWIVGLVISAQREKQIFTIALAGGSTPRGVYELLADENQPYRAELCWGKIHFFWGDERHVPPDHPDSNYRMANEAMLSRVPVPLKNLHRVKTELADAGDAAYQYEQTLVEFFRLRQGHLPRFDLVMLGMGSDGHTASIFPNSDVVNERERLVVAPWVEKLASFRITLTLPVINNAASIIFLVAGVEKAKVLRQALEGDHELDRLPVQLIKPTSGSLSWLADRDAASLLK